MTGRDYLRVFAKSWTTIVVALVACVLLSVLVGVLTPPKYSATTQLFVSTRIDANNVNQQLYQGGTFSADRVKSYVNVATSPRVTVPAIAAAHADVTPEELAGRISASIPSDTVVIEVAVTDGSAAQAANLTNAVGDQLAQVIQQLETPPGSSQSPVRATIINPAGVPTSPVLPNWPLTIALGILAGLIVGFAVSILRESLDSTIRVEADVQRLSGVPNLGKILFEEAAERGGAIQERDSRSESFRHLRTNLQFSSVDMGDGTVVVTSAMPGDGKTSITANLGIALAELGVRVALVGADLRRPALADYFGLANEVGLTSVIIGHTSLDVALQTVRPNLWVLGSGPLPPNPSELLASDSAAAAFKELTSRCDMVLIDTAPVLPVTDAQVLASRADGVLVVVRSGTTTQHQLTEAMESLRRVQARVLGTVLNRISGKDRGDGYYGYYGHYGHYGASGDSSKSNGSDSSNGKDDQPPIAEGVGSGTPGGSEAGGENPAGPPRPTPQPAEPPRPPSPTMRTLSPRSPELSADV